MCMREVWCLLILWQAHSLMWLDCCMKVLWIYVFFCFLELDYHNISLTFDSYPIWTGVLTNNGSILASDVNTVIVVFCASAISWEFYCLLHSARWDALFIPLGPWMKIKWVKDHDRMNSSSCYFVTGLCNSPETSSASSLQINLVHFSSI